MVDDIKHFMSEFWAAEETISETLRTCHLEKLKRFEKGSERKTLGGEKKGSYIDIRTGVEGEHREGSGATSERRIAVNFLEQMKHTDLTSREAPVDNSK